MSATLGTLFYTLFKGKLVGKDKFGNKYYQARGELNSIDKKKRWVIYNGKIEASKVPAEWHGWLHYTTDALPSETTEASYSWIKEHLPNLTGTKHAYVPPGDISAGGKRAATVADYEAWKPEA